MGFAAQREFKSRTTIVDAENAAELRHWRRGRWPKKLQVYSQGLLDGRTENLIRHRTDRPSEPVFIDGSDLMCQDKRFSP